ncbi:MAG: oligosaccharide flippase family protein [Prevotella sp.]|nr:oligosaccharide flippase family protein [Bacteroides sp.]MCM1367063.1 oligosaccharide flippase family protein [Prevotella sp.]MCM1437038.1 oligosaccharide flippase family protein [Prevotella sp.]
MSGKKSINSSIVKVLSVFTSVQVLNMVCSIIKMKFVSLWLEAAGIGLFGIFQVVTDTISTITDFGLRQSATREVALNRNKPSKLGRLFATIRSWNLLIGIIGFLLLTIFSPLLSSLFFKTYSFWWNFSLLGFCIMLNALSAGENSILQGLSHFKQLARAGLLASVTGLAISIPMFRFLGINSVILTIFVYAACTFFFVFINRPKEITDQRPAFHLLREGKGFAKLGGYMAFAAFLSSLSVTAFVTWLNRFASVEEVGYFQAGNTLVIRYVGFIITAIGLEFYPRISASAKHNHRQSIFATHEIALTINILTPLVIIFLAARHLLVDILYTPQFDVIIPFITLGIIHTIFRTPSIIISYTIISQGNGLIYFFIEATDSIIGLSLCIASYYYFGLLGIGIAYILWYAIYLIMVWSVAQLKFKLKIGTGAKQALAISFPLTISAVCAVTYLPTAIHLPLMAAACIPYIIIISNTFRRKKN